MNGPVRAIQIVIAAIAACVVITFAINIYSGGTVLEALKEKRIGSMQMERTETDWETYAGATVTGADVKNVIKLARKETLCVTVDNGQSVTSYNYEDSTLAVRQTDEEFDDAYGRMCNFGNSTYIDPTADYTCSITEGLNKEIAELVFTVK